jgi:hypothetical protein
MRIVFKILFTVSIVTVLLVVGYEYLTAYYQATAHIAKIRTLHVKNLHSEKVDRFLRDLKVVESMNPFSLAEGGKDAGILLNKGLPMPIKGTDAPAHETLVPTLFSNPSDWSNSGATLPVKQLLELDVDWVASLSAYSHWDLDQSGIAAQKELSEYAIMGWVNKSISRNIQVAQIASYAVL